jgi:3-oxoacyl-[acyl-carrier protein] reductase
MVGSNPDWVVVSGANGSLGREIFDHFVAGQRRVLGLDRDLNRLLPPGDSASGVVRSVDLTSEAEVKAALDAGIPQGERIGLLINAVGQIWNEPVVKLSAGKFLAHGVASWRQAIEANLTAPFIVASETAARMARKGRGTIINFSSISSRGNVGQAAYSAAKSGIEGLTRAMAAELGPLGIRVNAIAPGFVDVPSTHAALSEAQIKSLAERTPVRRLGRSGELIDAIEFLANNAFVNGEVLALDGGLRL